MRGHGGAGGRVYVSGDGVPQTEHSA